MKKIFIAICLLLCCKISYAGVQTSSDNYDYPPIIVKLQKIIENNKDCKQKLEHLLENSGVPEWQNRSISEFVDFFDEWLTFDPTPTAVKTYVNDIYTLFAAPGGREVLGSEPLIDWLRLFMIARGCYLDSPQSCSTLDEWIKDPEIEINQYKIPDCGFKSFNDFFTRQINRFERPVCISKNVIDMPADGYVWRIPESNICFPSFNLKNDKINIKELFGFNPIYKKFIAGSAVIVFLQATDYHHFWSPVTGRIIAEGQLSGFYVAGGNPVSNTNHRRAFYVFKTPKLGYIGMGIIGMYDISSIQLIKNIGDTVKVGEELGHFAYGGSEIILLFQYGKVDLSDVPLSPFSTKKVGEKIGSGIIIPDSPI